jgi:hypothetical protein
MNKSNLLIVCVFISLLTGLLSIDTAKGNGYVMSLMPREHMLSPLNQTYTTNSVTAEATIELSPKIYTWTTENDMYFFLDRKPYVDNATYTPPQVFHVNPTYEGNTSEGFYIFRGKTVIGNLSDGEHLLEIGFSPCGLGTIDQYKSKAVFRIDTQNSEIPELSAIILLPLLLFTIFIVYRKCRKKEV